MNPAGQPFDYWMLLGHGLIVAGLMIGFALCLIGMAICARRAIGGKSKERRAR